MSVAAFDTLKFVRALREKAKLSAEQAEGFADAIAEAIQSDLSTKADIEDVRTDLGKTEQRLKTDLRETGQRLEVDIRATEQRLEAKLREAELRLQATIEATKAEIIKWMFGTIGFQTLIILGAVIALSRVLQP